jgi:hypothetical protein
MARTIQSVDRARGILSLFDSTGAFPGVSEMACAMGYYLSADNMPVGSPLWSRPPAGIHHHPP